MDEKKGRVRGPVYFGFDEVPGGGKGRCIPVGSKTPETQTQPVVHPPILGEMYIPCTGKPTINPPKEILDARASEDSLRAIREKLFYQRYEGLHVAVRRRKSADSDEETPEIFAYANTQLAVLDAIKISGIGADNTYYTTYVPRPDEIHSDMARSQEKIRIREENATH